ncbi:MAG: thiamine-phosphate kinase [bacterium]|nr:thiamine-phosphate kinase [bacterium]
MGIKLKDIGEINLIKHLQNTIHYTHPSIIVGIGDDAAVIKNSFNKYLVATTDTLVENVHFNLKTFNPYQVGWKSAASNLSDIAAMGAQPKYLLVSMGIPENLTLSFWDEIYRGIRELSSNYEACIIGGNTVRSTKLFINITLLGEVEKDNYIKRKGATIGEKLIVTGYLGDSWAGFNILENSININKKAKEFLINKHLLPQPRINEGLIISKNKIASCMIDISDGLSNELYRLKEENKIGFKVFEEKIPCSPALKIFSQKKNINLTEIALSGGEDYELLFTCKENKLKILQDAKIDFFVIGETISENEVIILNKKGDSRIIKKSGYEHFKNNY